MSELWNSEQARQQHPILAFFAGRPITVSVLLAATAVVGLIALRLLPIEMFPGGLESKSLNVEVPYNRAGGTVSPMTVEREVTLIVEAELSTIPGVRELWATSQSDEADFSLQFDTSRNMNDAYAEVVAAMERARVRLPADTGRIRVSRWRGSSGSMPVAFLGISWDESAEDADLRLERVIQPHIENIDGVASVTFMGGKRHYIAIDFDPELVRSYDVNLNALLGQLRGDNFRQPAGKIIADEGDSAGREVYLVSDSRFTGIADIEALPVRPGLQLSQITRHGVSPLTGLPHRGVYETYSVGNIVRTNGRPGATAMVFLSGDANTVVVGERLEAALEELRKNPELAGFNLRSVYNAGTTITESIRNLADTLLWGGALAFLVLLLFLKSWRLSLVIAMSIPLCMTLTLAVMFFAGQTINLLALMGFTLAGGMLLDNAIVVAENVYRRHAMGEGAFAAAVRGAGEIGLALVLATSTTVIVFVTVIFIADAEFISFVMGKIGLPVCVSLGFSILLALAVVPMTMNTAGLLAPEREGRLRGRFVALRPRLVARWRDGTRITAALGLAAWEIGALFIGRNAVGVPGSPWVDALGRHYDRAIGRLMPVRFVFVLVVLVLTVLGVILLPGALIKTDQNQGNRDRIEIGVRFPGSSDVAVARRALMITALAPDGPAARAGLRIGDFVLAHQGRQVSDIETLRRYEAETDPSRRVYLLVARGTLSGNIELTGGPSGIDGAPEETMPLRDSVAARYIDDLNRTFLGVEGADLKRAQAMANEGITEEEALLRFGRTRAEAQEYFGYETMSVSWGDRRARVWFYLDKARVEQAPEFFKRINAAMPERAGVSSQGEFQGGSGGGEVSVRISGPDTERLLLLAEDIAVRLGSIPGLEAVRVDAEEGMEEVTLAIERDRAAAMGVSPGMLSQVLAFQLGGTALRDFQRGETLLPLRVRFAAETDASGGARPINLQDVAETRVPGAEGGAVAAKAITSTTGLAHSGLGEIRRRNRQTSLRVIGTTSSEDLERIRNQVNMSLEGVQLPAGYSRELGGRFAEFGAQFDDLQKNLIWVGALVFLLMCFLFESLTKPLSILLASIPGALFGGFGALWLFATPLDNITYLGLMVLVGLVVNNGIVLVDLINRLRGEGMQRDEAVRTASRQRLRPILLTTLTTAFGLIPMAIGDAQFVGTPYYPMGRLVLGGLMVSMLYTLLLVPLWYTVIDDISAVVNGWLAAVFAPRARGAGAATQAPASPE